jgi:chemotaxis protein histidine kinase CheA
LLHSQLHEEKQNQINERQKHQQAIKQYIQKEVEASEAYANLEKVLKDQQEAHKRILEVSNAQADYQKNICRLGDDISNYMIEKYHNPDGVQTKDKAKKILEDLINIESSIQKSEIEIAKEAALHQNQILKTTKFLQQGIHNTAKKSYQLIVDETRSKLERLKSAQIAIYSGLTAIRERFTNKKSRQGDFQSDEKVKNYSYFVTIMRIVLLFVLSASMSFRSAAKALKINSLFFDIATPCHTTIIDWSRKIGFFVYHQAKEKIKESLWIVDFSIQIGTQKLMLVLRADLSKVHSQKKYNKCNKGKRNKLDINFHNVEVIHMQILESTSYVYTLSELEQILEKCGAPLFIVSDEGSDLSKGIRMFIEKHPSIEHINDISHKISNILKAKLENDLKWKKFCQIVTEIKQKIKLSVIAHMCPPQFRKKVRFLNVRDPIKWAFQMLNIKVASIPKAEREHFVTYIQKPLLAFKNKIIQWQEIANFITEVESQIKHYGLTCGNGSQIQSTSQILTALYPKKRISKYVLGVMNPIFEFIKRQEAKLTPGQIVISSSDIIESMFGKWKSMAPENSMVGITDNIFIFPLLTVNLTTELIKKALEEVHTQQIDEWRNKVLGKTTYTKRRAVFKKKKRRINGQKSEGSS